MSKGRRGEKWEGEEEWRYCRKERCIYVSTKQIDGISWYCSNGTVANKMC